MPTEAELLEERQRKLGEIRRSGVNPYPYTFDVTAHAADLHQRYGPLEKEQVTKDKVRVAGRIMALRRMGKITFASVQDSTARVQLYLKEEDLGAERYDFLKLLDIGDWVGAGGEIFKTKTGEVTVWVRSLELFAKSVRPLPDKWHGLADVEQRYRQRYLDLIINPEARRRLELRTRIVAAVRDFFVQRKFLEVETPILQPIYGGANARPFVTHHHDLDMKMFLRISLELYHKRLIVGGFDRVFEIGKVFRNESIDREHNPEFTLLEAYQAYADYNGIMELFESLYEYVAKKVLGTTAIKYQGVDIELKKPWRRVTMAAAIKEHAGIDVDALEDKELRSLIVKHGLEVKGDSRGLIIAELFDKLVSPKLIQPTMVIDHPLETTPLCKPHRKDPSLVERFEPFINGWEVGNCYSELNDPILQRALLEEQARNLKGGDVEANPMDEDFVRAIEHGMPPTGGLGLGIDRMVMLLTDAPSIRDVILFPTLRQKE